MYTVFIDGQAGTTGLQIHQRLQALDGIQVLEIEPTLRKDDDAKRECMRQADVVILCLHDEHARASVALANGLPASEQPRIIDASTAHRTHVDWVYGFAELCSGQRERIANAQRVANPGCYATGALALLRPLVQSGVLPATAHITLPAVSGYSGGGNAMIAEFESATADSQFLYALTLNHKHLPEIVQHAGLKHEPLFVPSVGNFAQGMIVQLPLHKAQLTAEHDADSVRTAYRAHYGQFARSSVRLIDWDSSARFSALALNNTNALEIAVVENGDRILAIARLDNLGKGAGGAAVQNLMIMLGLGGA